MSASQKKIDDFWKWFLSIANMFGDRFENQPLIHELDGRITDLGSFGWEIGPGEDPTLNALAISPGGDREKLAETRRIISNAPVCPGWEFHAAKPPKGWNKRLFIMSRETGEDVEVDATNWRYSLLRFPDGTFDIIISAPNMCQFTESERQIAAEILLDGELGEERRIELIANIDVRDRFETSEKSNSIEVLSDHLSSLTTRKSK